MIISGIEGLRAAGQAAEAAGLDPSAGAAGGDDFLTRLSAAIGSVDEAQQAGDASLQALAAGEEADLHGTMIALEQADIALRTMVTARDKVVNAYEQLMNMAI